MGAGTFPSLLYPQHEEQYRVGTPKIFVELVIGSSQYFCPIDKYHGPKNLADYSPWDRKKSQT